MRVKTGLAIMSAVALLASAPLLAASREERISFAPRTSSKTIRGFVKGNDYVDYVIGARGGQLLTVNLRTNRGSNYFNIMPKGSEAAYFIGSNSGNAFRGPVPSTGDQVIRVYLYRNDARRGVSANFTLTVSIAD